MQTKLLLSTSLCAIPAALFAAEVWQKPSSDWSEKDCSKIVAKSPWAKDTAVTMATGMGSPNSGGSGGRGGRGGGGGGMGETGGGGGGQAFEAPHVTIRWDSAAPMREAMKQVSLSKAVADEDVKAFYIVTVEGVRLGGGRGGQNAGQQPAGPRKLPPEQADRLKEATTLSAKGKDPISPADIMVMPGDEGKMTFRYYFPRSADYSLDDKEVTFQTKVMGRMELKQKFVLKEMVFDGKLSL